MALVLAHAGAAPAAWAGSRGVGPFTALVAVMGLPGLVEATLGTVRSQEGFAKSRTCGLNSLVRV